MTLMELLEDKLAWHFTFYCYGVSGLKGADFSTILDGLQNEVVSVNSTIHIPLPTLFPPADSDYSLEFWLEPTSEVVVWNIPKFPHSGREQRCEVLVGIPLFKDTFADQINFNGNPSCLNVHDLVSVAIDREITKATKVPPSAVLPSSLKVDPKLAEEIL
jgi:hypothetical protein